MSTKEPVKDYIDKILKVAEDHYVVYLADQEPIIVKSLCAEQIVKNIIKHGAAWYRSVDILPAGNKRVT